MTYHFGHRCQLDNVIHNIELHWTIFMLHWTSKLHFLSHWTSLQRTVFLLVLLVGELSSSVGDLPSISDLSPLVGDIIS